MSGSSRIESMVWFHRPTDYTCIADSMLGLGCKHFMHFIAIRASGYTTRPEPPCGRAEATRNRACERWRARKGADLRTRSPVLSLRNVALTASYLRPQPRHPGKGGQLLARGGNPVRYRDKELQPLRLGRIAPISCPS